MSETLTLTAGGDINPSRFIKHSTAANSTALEATAGDVTIGIAEEGAADAPIPGASTLAAKAGDMIEYAPLGKKVKLQIGSGGCTAGQALGSDANGKGVAAANNSWCGAIALETAVEDELADVQVFGFYVSSS